MDIFGGKNPKRIEKYRQQIFCTCPPFQIRQMETEQHHIPGNGIGKDLAPAEIGIDIQKAADDTQHTRRCQALCVGIL